MGIVGGDLLKAIMLARQQPRAAALNRLPRWPWDRVIGLYMLFVVGVDDDPADRFFGATKWPKSATSVWQRS